MAFDDTSRFPLNIAYGSRGGPFIESSIITLDSGAEERISRWSTPIHKYNVKYGIRNLSDLTAVLEMYTAMDGPVIGFRFKDFADFTSANDHFSAHSNLDVAIASGDGSTTTFQLIKRYTYGSTTRTRIIEKPVVGTTVVAFDGVNQPTGWTVNNTTGILTFTVAPGVGVSITAGFEFDVPARFEAIDVLDISHDSFQAGTLQNIPIIELKNPAQTQEEFPFGGAVDLGVITANVAISLQNGRVIEVTPDAGLSLVLPDATLLETGGIHFVVYNKSGTNSINLVQNDLTLVKVLPINSVTMVCLGVSTWLVI